MNIFNEISSLLLSKRIFILFSVALVAYNVIGINFYYSPLGFPDYWEHLAAMYSFSSNLLNPPNPYLLSDQPAHLFTPYHLFWGGISKITSIHIFWLLPVVSGVNMILFCLGVRAFCKEFVGDEKYSLTLLMAMLFLWLMPWGWSGFYNFGLLPGVSIYPYVFAFSVALLLIAKIGKNSNWHVNICFGLAAGIVFLSHPLTGSFLLLSVTIKLFLDRSLPGDRRIIIFLYPLVLTSLAIFLWPYFPVLNTVIKSASFSDLGFAGEWAMFYDKAGLRVLPSLLGVPFIAYMLYKKRFTYVSVGFVAVISIYALNYIFIHNSTFSRYIIYIAFFGQVSIVLLIKHLESTGFYKKSLAVFVLLVISLSALQLQQSAKAISIVRGVFMTGDVWSGSTTKQFQKFSELKNLIKDTDVVMAPMDASWRLPGIIGCKVVGVGHSNPFMTDFFERKLSVEKFFSTKSSVEERYKIIDKYSVDYVFVPKEHSDDLSDLTSDLALAFKGEDFSLFRL